MGQLENYSRKTFFMFLLFISVSGIFVGAAYLLKVLSPILLPITLVYILSLVLRLPYDALDKKLNKPKLSFSIVVITLMGLILLLGWNFGSGVTAQFNHLSSSIVNHLPKIMCFIEENSPLVAEFIKKIQLDQNIGLFLNGDIISYITSTTSKIVMGMGNGVFSLVMSVVTWIVIPSFIYVLVTRPIEKEDIQKWFSFLGGVTSDSIGDIFVEFRKNLEIYFSKQVVISVLHFLILVAGFYFFSFSALVALAVIFAVFNLIPNLGSTLLILSSPIVAMLCNVNPDDGVPRDYWFGVGITIALGVLLLILDNIHIFFPWLLKVASRKITLWQEQVIIHPAIITASIIFWGYILDGIFGLILSVPITILVTTIIKNNSNKAI